MWSVFLLCVCFFFFKQKTAYEMRISDWSSDACSSDLCRRLVGGLCGLCQLLRRGRGRAEGRRCLPGRGGLRADGPVSVHGPLRRLSEPEIGRASCRERVCQYV